MDKILFDIGREVYESKDFDYDSIGMSEDGKTLGIGYINNPKASILLHKVDDQQINLSYNEKLRPHEVLKFFILMAERIPRKVSVVNDFK